MNSITKKFNPLEMDEEEVLALATGRERLLKVMLEELKQCLGTGSSQHYILYGPRGIGKSFFTRLLKLHHDKSELFKTSLFIQLPEEQDNINFTADLLDVISIILEGGKLIDAKPRWEISTLQWQESVKRLKKILKKIAEEKNITHVFITQENLQVFIPKLDNLESGRMREFLSDFDEITIIGSSLRPDLDNNYSKKLFQVFKKLDIEPWGEADFLKYYERKALRFNNNQEKLGQLKKSKNKIKAIAKFTGGSPRLAVILSNLILDKNILETTELLDGIIDDLTSYYQDITNDIPPKSKILFDMLIRKGENMTQSALAQSFDPPLEQSTIARSFSWLIENYYLDSSKQLKGNTKNFYVRDRLYVLYYQKRQIYADVPFSIVAIFVDFLTEYYTQKDLQLEISNLSINHPYSKPLLSHLAQKENLIIDEFQEADFIKDQLLLQYSNNLKNNEVREPELNDTIVAYIENGKYDKAIEISQKALKLNPNNISALHNIGVAYGNQGELNKAIEAFQKIADLNPIYDSEFKNKGDFFYLNHYGTFYNNFGITLMRNGEFDKAIEIFQKEINLNKYSVLPYNNLATTYHQKNEITNSLKIIKKGLDSIPNSKVLLLRCIFYLILTESWNEINKELQNWKFLDSKSNIIGKVLANVLIQDDTSDKFYLFKKTIELASENSFINKYELINSLCITLISIDKNKPILQQIIDELAYESKNDILLTISLQVIKYIIDPEKYDINQLHPDARTVVESVLEDEKFKNSSQ